MKSQSPPASAGREMDLLGALNAAAAALQRSALSEEKVLAAFGEQIASLGLYGGVVWLDEGRQNLVVRKAVYPGHQRLRARLEKLTTLRSQGFTFPLDKVDVYRQTAETGASIFVADNTAIILQILPERAQPFASPILKAFGKTPAIYTALRLGGEVQGVLGINGKYLTAEDVSAVEAFANHISVALENARLLTAAQQAEAKYRRLFEAANDGFIIVDAAAGTILSANRKAQEITGYNETELLDLPMGRLTLPEEAGRARAFFAAIRQGGEGIIEIPLIRRDGAVRLIEITASVYEAEGQRLMHGLLRDISDRKQAEQALRESEANFRALTEAAASAIFIYQGERFVYVNQALEEISGFSREELLAMPFWQLVHPEFRALVHERGLARQRGENLPPRYEFKIVSKTGEEKWVDFTARAIAFGGQPAGLGTAFDITRRKQAEVELRRLKEFNEDIVQATSEGIAIEESSGNLSFVNPAAAELLGYTVEELSHAHWATIVPPDQRPIVEQANLMRRQGVSSSYELEVFRKDGTRIPVQVSGSPRFDENGAFAGNYVVFTDISERKRIENELRRLKEFNEGIVLNVSEGIGIGDAAGFFTFVNPAMAKMLGYEPQELLHTHFLDTVPADQHAVILAADERRKHGEADRYELDLLRKNGSRITVLVSGTPRFEDGQFSGSLVVFTDISERKRAENALRESEQKFRSVIEQSTDGIVLIDELGAITVWNQGQEAISGLKRAEVLGRAIWDVQFQVAPPELVLPQILEQARNSTRELLRTGKAPWSNQVREQEILRPDGSRRTIQTVAFPVKTGGGFIAGSISRDVTENKQLEEALRRRAEELAVLYEVSLDVSASLDLPTLLKTIIERAVRLLDASSGGSLYLCNNERQEATIMVCFRTPRDYAGITLKYGDGASGRVAQTGKPIIVDDYQHWEGRAAAYEGDALTALLAVPMNWKENTVGVITVMDERENRTFSNTDQELLTLFASQAGIAIENARLLAAERAAHAQAEILRDASRAVGSSLELKKVLQTILEQLKRVLVYDTASVLLLGERTVPALVAVIGYDDPVMTSTAAGDLLQNSRIFPKMAQNLESIIIPDVRENADWIWIPGAEHVRSFLAVPIIYGVRMIGVLMADSANINAFSPADIRVAQSLAQQMAVAIENARLFEAEQAQLLLAQTLQEVGALLTSQSTLDTVLERLLDLLARVVQFDSASLQLADENGRLYLAAGRGFEDIEWARKTIRDLGSTVLNQLGDHRFVVIPDTLLDSRWVAIPGTKYIRSWVGAPLLVRGQFIGALTIDSTLSNCYNDASGETVSAFANQAGVAIENARLFEAAEKRAQELEAVRQASLGLTASLDLEAVLDAIMDSALKLLPGAQHARVFLYDPETQTLTFGAALLADGQSGSRVSFPRPAGLTYTVARSGQAMLVANVSEHPLYQNLPASFDISGSIASLPLKIGQRVVGVMNIFHPRPYAIRETDLRVLRLLGDQAAIAIENAHLFEQAATERRHLGLLFDVGRAIAASLDPVAILHSAISLTCQALGGLFGEAFLYEPKTGRLRMCAQHGKDEAHISLLNEQLQSIPGEGLAGWSAVNRMAVNIPDVTQDERWVSIPGEGDDVRSALTAPIVEGDRLLGVIAVLHQQAAAFTSAHLNLLVAICQQVALALSNAGRYQQVENLVDLLAAEQNRLENLVERLPVGVMLLDSDQVVLIANSMAQEILAAIGSAETNDKLTHIGAASLAELFAQHAEPVPLEIVSTGEPRIIVEAQALPLQGSEGRWILTVRDVTRERESQARIQMQERLATVGQLAAGIAHDFNNIMASIMVYTDLLMADRGIAPASRDRLDIIQRQVQRAASLIRQILDFSRRSVMEQSAVDLLPFVKEMEKLLARVLPETIRLELSYQPGSYLVQADPTRLQQVFMNLALNARDAMPAGGKISFSMNPFTLKPGQPPPCPDLPPGIWIKIAITDTGHGISPEVLPHIFEPFFTTKPVGKGTGLGLSQVYGIVKQHDGHIDVTSPSGEGATFAIYLPAVPTAPEENRASAVLPRLEGNGRAVLVVEDDATTREALHALLTTYNFWVLSASNGVEALRLLSQASDSVALVLTDVVMPEMGGVKLYHTLRERWPNVKVLFVTGHPLDAESQALLETGSVHWLNKPFSAEAFTRAVQGLLAAD